MRRALSGGGDLHRIRIDIDADLMIFGLATSFERVSALFNVHWQDRVIVDGWLSGVSLLRLRLLDFGGYVVKQAICHWDRANAP